MALRDYLAGEVVEDFADGHITRRDALRRLALLGVSLTSASTLLAACGDGGDSDDGDGATRTTASTPTTDTTSTAPPASDVAGSTEVRFAGPAGELIGAYAEPTKESQGALLVIHENGGLTDYFRRLVGELASEGYYALCVDLLSRAGGTAAQSSNGSVQAALGQAPIGELLADLAAGIDELQKRAGPDKVGVVGFCFGGAMTWSLLNEGEPRIAAAVPFYGPAPADPDFSKTDAAVLAIYAELDARVNASRDAAAAALEDAGLTHEVRTFPGVNHAFFNPTGPRYNEQAATEARAAMLAWFDQHI